MKRSYIALLCVFILNVTSIKAQTPSTTIPNPAATLQGWQYLSIYGVDGKAGSFLSGDGASITSYGTNNEGIIITSSTYSSGILNQGVNLGSGITKYNKLNFVFSGSLNKIYAEEGNSFFTDYPNNFNITVTSIDGSDWKLASIVIPDNITSFASLRFEVNSYNGSELYLANIYLTRDATDGPLVPAPTPDSSMPHASVYSDVTGYNYNWVGKWENGPTHSEYTINSAEKALKVSWQAGAPWSNGFIIDLEPLNISAFTYFSLDMYSDLAFADNIFRVTFKQGEGDGIDYHYNISGISTTKEWKTYNILLSDVDGLNLSEPIKQIVITNIADISSPAPVTYIDNIYFYLPTEPVIAPVTPVYEPGSVKYIYNESNNASGLVWTQGITNHEAAIDKDNSKKIVLASNSWKGAEFTNMDLTLPNGEAAALSLNVFVSQPNTNLLLRLNGGTEYEVASASAFTVGQWHTVEIPLTSLGVNSVTSIHFSGSGTIFVDNISLARPDYPLVPAPAPPSRLDNTFFSLYNDSPYGSAPGAFGGNGAYANYEISVGESCEKVTLTPVDGNHSSVEYGLDAASADLTGYNVFSCDVWLNEQLSSDNQLFVRLYANDRDGKWWGIHAYIPQSTPVRQWATIDIDLSDFQKTSWGEFEPEHILQNFKYIEFRIDGGGDPASFYIDNIYFYLDLSPRQEAPLPSLPQTDVISVFSDSYSNNLAAGYTGFADGNVSGNNYKKIANLNPGANIALDSYVSVSSKNLLHMDVWVEDSENTELELVLTDNSGNNSISVPISESQLQGGVWNSINVLLNDFRGISLDAIKELSFSGSNHTVYVDNIYFYSNNPTANDKSPTPESIDDPEVVLSLYSDFYTNSTLSGTVIPDKGYISQNFSAGGNYLSVPGMSQYVSFDLTGITSPVSSSTWHFLHIDARAASGTTSVDMKIEGTKLDGTSGATTITQEVDDSGWTKIDISTASSNIPSGAVIESIKLASREGFIFLDNIYFHKSISSNQVDVVKVEGANEDTEGAVNKFYPSLYEAFSAVSTGQTGADIKLILHKTSIEDRTITIVNSDWNSLTLSSLTNDSIIFRPVASLNQTFLLNFHNTKNVVIDGTTAESERGLTLIGYYNVNAGWGFDSNAIIHFGNSEGGVNDNFIIKNCVFTNNTGNRSVGAIAGFGIQNFEFRNNEFRNCLNLKTDSEQTITGVMYLSNQGSDASATSSWNIIGNYFYENEDDISFEDSHARNFIRIEQVLPNPDFTLLVDSNRIGGSGIDSDGNITGTMKYSGTSSHITGIEFYAHNFTVNAKVTISNNIIANFDCENRTTFFKYFVGDEYMEGNVLARFVGISARNGNIEITENQIENVLWKSREFAIEDGKYNYVIFGISMTCAETEVPANFICRNNKIKGLLFQMIPDGGHKMFIAYDGIKLNTEKEAIAEISGNRVIGEINDTYAYHQTSEVNAIFVEELSGKSGIDIFNNICMMKKFIIGGGVGLHNAAVYGTFIRYQYYPDNSSAFNFYNNIAYVQGDFNAGGSFSGIRNAYSSTKSIDKINFYQNTVFINLPATTQQTSALLYQIDGAGEMRSWNNNIVSLNENGTLVALNDFDYNGGKNPISFDYNNYYSPKTSDDWTYLFATGFTSPGAAWKPIFTFDKWKFENPIIYLDRYGERDFHSSFVNPKFNNDENNIVSIDDSFEGLEKLKTLLRPHAFVAGHELSGLPGTDKDIVPSERRTSLPTAGAIETELPNCWQGGQVADRESDWSAAANWTNGEIPDGDEGDVLFHPNPLSNLVLDGNREIRNIFNASAFDVDVNGKELTISGLIRMDGEGKVIATGDSKIIYEPGVNRGAVVQHLFENTYKDNKVTNLTLTNQTDYYVLLYDKLEITNELVVQNGIGDGKGALNCSYFDTELKLSGTDTLYIPQYTIYNDTLYDLVIDNSERVIDNQDNLYIKNNLTINAAKVFEISAGKFVKVDGLTANMGGNSGLIIKSRVSDSDKTPNATFISNPILNDSDNKIPATVEMFSPAKINDQGDYRWQYFTVPVEETLPVNADARLWNTWIRRWDPSGVNRDSYFGTPYWIYLENNHNLSPIAGKAIYSHPSYGKDKKPVATTSYALQGYEITMNTNRVVPFVGNLVNSAFSLTLGYNEYDEENPWTPVPGESWNEQTAMNGQYVVGNPYTAAIDIKALQFGQSLDPTVYIYNTGSYREWQSHNNSDSDNKYQYNPGQYLAVPWHLAGQGNLPSHIPSMQGFLVMRNDNTGTPAQNTLTLDYNATETNKTIGKNTEIQRAGRIEQKLPHTVIDLDGEHYGDRLWIFINPECTKGYNSGWDGRKFATEVGPAQLFTVEDEEYYQVSTMDDIDRTYLGFSPGEKDDLYTLTFNHTDMDQEYSAIQLYDLIEGKVTDVTESGSTYSFEVTDHTYTGIRFMISTETRITTDVEDIHETNSKLGIYTQDNLIFIDNKTDYAGTATIYDMAGRCLFVKPFDKEKITGLETKLPAGSYVVSLSTMHEFINKSVIIK